MKFALEKIQIKLERLGKKQPFVLRCTRNTAIKIADALGKTWLHTEKGKLEVGPFLIIA